VFHGKAGPNVEIFLPVFTPVESFGNFAFFLGLFEMVENFQNKAKLPLMEKHPANQLIW